LALEVLLVLAMVSAQQPWLRLHPLTPSFPARWIAVEVVLFRLERLLLALGGDGYLLGAMVV
jgi:hypothetical protein